MARISTTPRTRPRINRKSAKRYQKDTASTPPRTVNGLPRRVFLIIRIVCFAVWNIGKTPHLKKGVGMDNLDVPGIVPSSP